MKKPRGSGALIDENNALDLLQIGRQIAATVTAANTVGGATVVARYRVRAFIGTRQLKSGRLEFIVRISQDASFRDKCPIRIVAGAVEKFDGIVQAVQ